MHGRRCLPSISDLSMRAAVNRRFPAVQLAIDPINVRISAWAVRRAGDLLENHNVPRLPIGPVGGQEREVDGASPEYFASEDAERGNGKQVPRSDLPPTTL